MNIRRDWVILALVTLGPLILFGPMLFSGKVLYWGTPIMQFVPWHEYALDVIRSGHFPFWNQLSGFGSPLFANYQSALLYPPNILLAVVGSAYGHGLLVAFHLVWAGLGMVFLARQLDLPPRAQLIAGIAFSLSGYMVARAWFISINHAAAWLPWIILASDRIARSNFLSIRNRQWIDILSLGVLFGMQWLSGHAQTSWYTLLFSIAWVIWRSFSHGGWRQLVQSGLTMVVAGGMGFILSAVQLVPTLEYLLQSQRSAGLDPEFALTYSFWPWRITELIAPGIFGNPASGTYWGYGNYWEDAIYVGIFPLLMALSSIALLFRNKKKERSIQGFLIGTSVISFLFALGKNTAVFSFLYDNIPSFNLFQAPSRWNLLFVFCLSLLAGFGIKYWHTPEGRGLYWTRLGTAGAGIIGLASYLGANVIGDVQATFVPALARAGVLLFIAGLLTLFLNKKSQTSLTLSVGAFVLLDLVTAGFGLNPAGDRSVFQGQSQLAQIIEGSHRVYMPLELEQKIKFEQTHRFDTFYPGIEWRLIRDVGLPNTTMLDGISSANNFDPVTPSRHAVWMQWLGSLDPERRDQVLRGADVRWRADSSEGGILGVSYADLGSGSRVRLLSDATQVPRAEDALEILSQPSFDVLEQVLIETEPQPLPKGSGGKASIKLQSDPNQVHIDASSKEGGWLLLCDTWYPGWRVTIDGEDAELFRANYLFMSVWVPEGNHRVEFHYLPTFIIQAGVLTAVGWLGTILLWARRRNR